MAQTANEIIRGRPPLQDQDGRLIVVGPDGVAISGGAGGGGADPLSDGTDAGALPTKTLWVAGADGAVLRGIRVDASGRVRTVLEGTPAVSVSNFPATQPVSGSVGVSNFPASQPVTGPVTDVQLRASAVPVSGPVTDAQLRASAVPVSGPLTDAQLRASAVPVSGSFFQATQPVSLAAVPTVTEKQDQPAGTTATWTSATALNTALTNTTVAGYGTANVSIQVPSTVTGGVITIEVSDDGTVWYPAGAVRVDNGIQENVVTLALSPGQASNRMYSVSVDAMTNIRARLSTAIVGAGNVVVRITLVAGGIEPFVAIRPRMVATYGAGYRLAAATAGSVFLSFTFAANTDKQLVTIHHPVSAGKTVRLRYCSLELVQGGVGIYSFELRQLSGATLPATGNPIITPGIYDASDTAAEATCLALPTTAGSYVNADRPVSPVLFWNSATSAATADPARAGQELVLHNSRDGIDRKPLTMRAGVAEGFAIVGRCSAAVIFNFTAYMEFTEEPA